jgi:hypothetical protein
MQPTDDEHSGFYLLLPVNLIKSANGALKVSSPHTPRRKIRPATRENVFWLMKSPPPREDSGEPCAGLYPAEEEKT